jgi:uncharacterized protein DUF3617
MISEGRGSMHVNWMTMVALQAAACSAPGLAADMSPGLWEITLESRAASQPGFAPEPFRITQCFSAADSMDPSKVLGGIANPGASGCTYSNKAYSDNTFRFSMQCAGSFALQSQGEVSFSADAMSGTITAVANVGAEKIELSNKVSARRLGGC